RSPCCRSRSAQRLLNLPGSIGFSAQADAGPTRRIQRTTGRVGVSAVPEISRRLGLESHD
ncbi:MAG TPA: hypothetical protein VK643_04255, partial [Burkholderiales bacterium]|nr:hypothetical protein [Burkholderiales bacterium]